MGRSEYQFSKIKLRWSGQTHEDMMSLIDLLEVHAYRRDYCQDCFGFVCLITVYHTKQ